eukprot:5755947-Prymnesium_polylepis.1
MRLGPGVSSTATTGMKLYGPTLPSRLAAPSKSEKDHNLAPVDASSTKMEGVPFCTPGALAARPLATSTPAAAPTAQPSPCPVSDP